MPHHFFCLSMRLHTLRKHISCFLSFLPSTWCCISQHHQMHCRLVFCLTLAGSNIPTLPPTMLPIATMVQGAVYHALIPCAFLCIVMVLTTIIPTAPSILNKCQWCCLLPPLRGLLTCLYENTRSWGRALLPWLFG